MKPCSDDPSLPCAFQGICHGKPYWKGQPFSGESDRKRLESLKECEYIDVLRKRGWDKKKQHKTR
jgi:hypothetical protein